MKKVIFLVSYIIYSLFITQKVLAFDKVKNDQAYKAIANYCQLEFLFDSPKRNDLFKTTPAYSKQNDIYGGEILPGRLSIGLDKIFAISSYKVLGITFGNNENEAVAKISYAILAKSDKCGDFYEYKNSNYIVEIKLIYTDKQWWILDPPTPPKVSINELLAYYEHALQERLSYGGPRPGEKFDAIQTRNYENDVNQLKSTVNLFKRLGGDSSKAVTRDGSKL